MYIREVAPTELACCMRSCVRPVRLIQSWLRRKRARSQRCSFESPSVAYDSPEHCQSTKHGSTSNRTTSQKIKVRVYPITCPLCKGLVTSERMGGTADVRVRNMGTISCRPFTTGNTKLMCFCLQFGRNMKQARTVRNLRPNS